MSTDQKCKSCKFYGRRELFDLCTHDKSEYHIDGDARLHYHTIRHMRKGVCGELALLRQAL